MSRSTRVLVADDDPVSRSVLVRLLERGGYECEIARDGTEAWAIAERDDAPQVMLVDWMMPGIEGPELCRRVRERGTRRYTYVALVSTRSRRADVNLGFEAGIDDFIAKPFRADEVLSRMMVAERVLAVSRGSTFDQVIEEARRQGGGDVIARSGDIVGRIMFHDGRVAWAHVSNETNALHSMLALELVIEPAEVHEVIEESGYSGRNFADVIVERGILGRTRLRACMRRWITQKIQTIRDLTSVSLIFVPENRPYEGELFELDEVLQSESMAVAFPGATWVSSGVETRSVELDPLAHRLLERAEAIDGATSVAIFDRRTGECLASRGQEIDIELVWQQIRIAAGIDVWGEIEDVNVTTPGAHHMVRFLPNMPLWLLYATVSRERANLGLVKVGLDACARLQPDTPVDLTGRVEAAPNRSVG